jgi:hypothetical protein
MDKWFKDILPDKDPYHNRGRSNMTKVDPTIFLNWDEYMFTTSPAWCVVIVNNKVFMLTTSPAWRVVIVNNKVFMLTTSPAWRVVIVNNKVFTMSISHVSQTYNSYHIKLFKISFPMWCILWIPKHMTLIPYSIATTF